ncbi:MAG: hypothetical protein KAH21_09425, partial [Spirochaetaceae bacterium]|nr:hypothetical protein [Spirochaetaceae bacterium]
FNPGYLFIGGGVSDSWQPAEEKLRLTRTVLELFKVFPNPLLLLTKSSLILRDFDLLTVLNDECRVIVAVSLSTVDEKLASILEPGASPPSERLEVVRRAKAAGFGTGVMLLPVVPGITDSPEQLDHVYSAVKNAGADFIAAGPMTLKKGRQWNYFMAAAKVHFPESVAGYQEVYGTVPDQWGNPSGAYYKYFGPLIHQISLRYGLPRRIPSRLFPDNLSKTERVMLMLDQMDGLLRDRGINSSFGRASRSIRKMENLQHAIEPGSDAEGTINEILDTGTSLVYERLLVGKNINETGLD